MRQSPGRAIAAAGAGVVVLAAMVGFAVGLPQISDASDSYPGGESQPIDLPDRLPGGLLAADSGQLDPQLAAQIDPERIAELQDSSGTSLADLFDAAAAVRLYTTADGSRQGFLMALDRAPGLFAPEGPPVDPAANGYARGSFDLVRIGDTVCDVTWGQPVPAGQPVDDAAVPARVDCQLGDGDRTYELVFSGITAEQAVEALESVVDGTAEDADPTESTPTPEPAPQPTAPQPDLSTPPAPSTQATTPPAR